MNWFSIVPDLIKGGFGLLNRGAERKKIKEKSLNKIAEAKADTKNSLNLSDKEWEAVGKAGEAESWKDEAITVTFLMPIWAILIGAVWRAMSGDASLLNGTLNGIKQLKELGLDFGELTYIVVLAGVAIKSVKGLR